MQIEVRKPSDADRAVSQDWPIWTKEATEFPWHYDERETCLILEGEAEVETDNGETASFGAGDWVVFSAGLECVWRIKRAIRKHYRFGD